MYTRTWKYYGFMSQGYVAATCPFVWTDSFIIVPRQFGGYFVPATCLMKFNKLNSVRHVLGTKYPLNWCCTIVKAPVHTRGHVAGTFSVTRPWYTSHQCALHKCSVAATCPCNISPHVCPPFYSERKTKRQKVAPYYDLSTLIISDVKT